MRKPIIVGNWKMNKTYQEAVDFVKEVDPKLEGMTHGDFGVAPTYLGLWGAQDAAKNLIISAQNVHFEPSGAYTGEVSVEMLKDINISWTILGHSERRQYFGETDETVNKKVKVCLEKGITPIVCVGESLEEFEAERTEEVVRKQLSEGLKDLSGDVKSIVIAYEPIWAIGTGKSATTEIAQNTCAIVRDELKNIFGEEAAEAIRIQYGGSVKPENIKEYMAQPDIDGALVGGASLKVDSFLELINAVK